jgi:hypothetical protein
MNRELTQDEARDQRTLLKILERQKLAEWLGGKEFYDQFTRNIDAMQASGTTDGEELAELTDEDAKERPWVMVADERNRWMWMRRPKILVSAPPASAIYIVVDDVNDKIATSWNHARLATENELKQAGITQ